jgi:hypothetical protein
MKTSFGDVRLRAAKCYFFLLFRTFVTAAFASFKEIVPGFEAGLRTKRPVAALRPRMASPRLEDLPYVVCVRVLMQ